MGKKYTTFLTLFTVICITLTGCERENEQTANQGRLNLKLAVDTNVENMVTRATADEETLPDINDFSIAVLQNNNVQLTWNRYADFTDGTEIAAGNYTLKATYGNKRLPLLHKNNNLWKKRLNSKSSIQKMQMIF